MSSAGYCVSSNAALLAGQSAAKAIDPLAEVVSFVDDTYFIGSPAAAVAGWKAYQQKLHADLHVRENQSKRKCLPGTGVDHTQLPSELSWCVVSSMDIVGAQMDCARADRVVPPSLRAGSSARAGPGGVQDGSLVREDHPVTPLQADDWRDVANNSDAGEVRPEPFLLSQKHTSTA